MSRLDDVADSVIRSGMKLAAAEGAGFGLGGIITILPDLGILSAITMRTIQKLSLIYGFELNTDDELPSCGSRPRARPALTSAANCSKRKSSTASCPSHSTDRSPGQRRSGREVGRAADSDYEFGHRLRAQLLLRASLGPARAGTFPQEALGSARPVGGGTTAVVCLTFDHDATVAFASPAGQ